jgi:teichuronic acid biosynthesis glycosyltransferase TuaC
MAPQLYRLGHEIGETQRMRILLLSHMYPNPVRPTDGTFVHDLAKALSNKCYLNVLAPVPFFPFLSLTSKYSGFNSIPLKDDTEDFKVLYPRFLFIPKYLKFTDWIGYLLSLFPVISRMKDAFDIIYVHWGYPDGLVAFICAKLLGKKVVLHVHGNESVCFFESSLRKLLVKAYLSKADHIIAVSSDLKEKIIRFYNVRKEAVSVVPNGIDVNLFKPLPKAEMRNRLNLNANEKILVSISRLSPEKRVDVLIEAFSLLKKMTSDPIKLYIIGRGPERQNIEALIKSKETSTSNDIHLVGPVAHDLIPEWLSAADLFCLSSDREGCPVSIIEAMGCERPVVATQVGGVADLIPDREYGFIVPPGRPREFAEALNVALSKPWNHDKIRFHAATYTWDGTADSVMGIFQNLI